MRRLACLLAAAALAGCANHPGANTRRASDLARAADAAGENVPPFARAAYAPFSRADAVAIALREWRLWGMPVDDDPPDSRPAPTLEQKPERAPGLWQRVGEYWWTGQDASNPDASWTGKHDQNGLEFTNDGNYAWSAAFISYIMRIAGAGGRFPYSPTHSDYINAARDVSLARSGVYAISAEALDVYAPRLGDLICLGRGSSQALTYADLPTRRAFPSHCDIVVGVAPGQLSVIGGNVDDSVTMKHVPVTADGHLSPPGGPPLDTRFSWLTVLRVHYDR